MRVRQPITAQYWLPWSRRVVCANIAACFGIYERVIAELWVIEIELCREFVRVRVRGIWRLDSVYQTIYEEFDLLTTQEMIAIYRYTTLHEWQIPVLSTRYRYSVSLAVSFSFQQQHNLGGGGKITNGARWRSTLAHIRESKGIKLVPVCTAFFSEWSRPTPTAVC